MKSNRTNCNLKTSIKKRRVYFKDRFYTKKSRLLAFLLLIKTTFFILYEKFNDKTRLAFQNLCFCKNFFRFRVLNRSPDFKEVYHTSMCFWPTLLPHEKQGFHRLKLSIRMCSFGIWWENLASRRATMLNH